MISRGDGGVCSRRAMARLGAGGAGDVGAGFTDNLWQQLITYINPPFWGSRGENLHSLLLDESEYDK